jgi:hypothetical protein
LALATRLFSYVELAVAAFAAGLWYLEGGAVWYAGSWPGPWPIVMVAGTWLVRVFVLRLSVRPSFFDLWLWAFVATAALGVWAAYDRDLAWAKLWLIVGALGVYYALAHMPDREHIYVALALFALFGAAVSVRR